MSPTRSHLRNIVLVAVASTCLVPLATHAQFPDQLPIPADVKAFATQYIAAINAKDSAKLWSYLTPETRACVTPQNKDVYDALFAIQLDDKIPLDYRLMFTAVNESNAKAMADRQYFPVKPEHQLQIDYQFGNDVTGLVLWIVHQNGRVYADQPCATEKFIKEYRDDAPQRAHYKEVAAQIQDPLRSELPKFIADHDRSSAISKYHDATGADMGTSMQVINALKQTADAAAN
jgi:hypothetical protein